MDINNEEFENLNDLSFEDVINGLNKYFAEDETRVRVPRSFIEVKIYQRLIYYRFDAEMYLDKLIAWLRTEHGIFYYPGMEAKYAKTERIPPLTERLMDEGALNSLKKLHKRVVGEEAEVDSHTLIADGISHAVSVKEVQIEELKQECDFLKDELGKDAVIREFLDRRRKIQTKLDTIEKKLEELLKDIKEEST